MSIYSIDNLEKKIPFFKIFKQIQEESGAKIYFAGGLVRDMILNKPVSDIDIVAENIEYTLLAKKIGKLLKSYPVAFKDNMRIMKDNAVIDISKLRGDNIAEDILKRDFTINNLALDLNGNITGSTKDLENKIIKVVSNTSIDDDPVRIVRAFRFASVYGFTIENNTLKQLKEKNNTLLTTAKERVLEEFRKMFKGKYLKDVLYIIKDNNIFNPLVESADLDYDKLIYALDYTNDFHMLLSLWVKNMDFINYLNLTLKEQKNINLYFSLDYNYLKSADNNDLLYFVFKNHNMINNISTYIALNFKDSSLSHKLINLDNSLDYEKSKLINGAFLINAGYKPSPLFSQIIDETSFLLAKGELNHHNILEYVSSKWEQ